MASIEAVIVFIAPKGWMIEDVFIEQPYSYIEKGRRKKLQLKKKIFYGLKKLRDAYVSKNN